MQRLLTGYAQYYNRRYRRMGHLFQGRYKAVFCESDRYLSELLESLYGFVIASFRSVSSGSI